MHARTMKMFTNNKGVGVVVDLPVRDIEIMKKKMRKKGIILTGLDALGFNTYPWFY